jgi:hypothetical protein
VGNEAGLESKAKQKPLFAQLGLGWGWGKDQEAEGNSLSFLPPPAFQSLSAAPFPWYVQGAAGTEAWTWPSPSPSITKPRLDGPLGAKRLDLSICQHTDARKFSVCSFCVPLQVGHKLLFFSFWYTCSLQSTLSHAGLKSLPCWHLLLDYLCWLLSLENQFHPSTSSNSISSWHFSVYPSWGTICGATLPTPSLPLQVSSLPGLHLDAWACVLHSTWHAAPAQQWIVGTLTTDHWPHKPSCENHPSN